MNTKQLYTIFADNAKLHFAQGEDLTEKVFSSLKQKEYQNIEVKEMVDNTDREIHMDFGLGVFAGERVKIWFDQTTLSFPLSQWALFKSQMKNCTEMLMETSKEFVKLYGRLSVLCLSREDFDALSKAVEVVNSFYSQKHNDFMGSV